MSTKWTGQNRPRWAKLVINSDVNKTLLSRPRQRSP